MLFVASLPAAPRLSWYLPVLSNDSNSLERRRRQKGVVFIRYQMIKTQRWSGQHGSLVWLTHTPIWFRYHHPTSPHIEEYQPRCKDVTTVRVLYSTTEQNNVGKDYIQRFDSTQDICQSVKIMCCPGMSLHYFVCSYAREAWLSVTWWSGRIDGFTILSWNYRTQADPTSH